MKNKKKGFTLAEVLITMTIIGIIAALTIPIILNDYNNKKMATTFKKAYSELSQATEYIKNDNGGSFISVCGYWNYSCLYQKYKPYLTGAKTCTDAQAEGCWHQPGQWTYNNGTPCNVYNDCNAPGYDAPKHPGGAILPSGALVVFIMYHNTCSNVACGEMYIDTNGFNPPNQVGKDIATVFIEPDNVIPDTRNIDLGLAKNYLLNQ